MADRRSQTVTSEILDISRGLRDERKVAGRPVSLNQMIAETTFLSLYGESVSSDQTLVDDRGSTLQVLLGTWRVSPARLEADALIFMEKQERTVGFLGWLPTASIEDAPVRWVTQNGKRVDYWHEVSEPFLMRLPDSFVFSDPCTHLKDWGAVWDYPFSGWTCFGCGRLIYDEQYRCRVVEQDRRFAGGDQVSAVEEGLQRKAVE